jgi:glycyl-tRNA synthetase
MTKRYLKTPIITKKLSIHPNYKNIENKNLIPIIINYFNQLTQSDLLNIQNIKECQFNVNEQTILLTNNMFYIKEQEEKITSVDYFPHVIEPSFGIDRLLYALFNHCFAIKIINNEERQILSLPISLTPYHVALFPLLNKSELVDVAMTIKNMLNKNQTTCFYNSSTTTIGKKYVQSDSIGILYTITVDYDTLIDSSVTIRHRDTMNQIRVKISNIVNYIKY